MQHYAAFHFCLQCLPEYRLNTESFRGSHYTKGHKKRTLIMQWPESFEQNLDPDKLAF